MVAERKIKPELMEWLEQNSHKVALEEQGFRYDKKETRVLRISFKDRRDTLMFKLANEITKV
jgi:hypothetical protein